MVSRSYQGAERAEPSLALTRIKAGVLLPQLGEPPFSSWTAPDSSTLSSCWPTRGTHCSRCHTGRNIQKNKFYHARLLVGVVVFYTTWSFLMSVIRHDAGDLSATAKRCDYRPESTKSDQVYSAMSQSLTDIRSHGASFILLQRKLNCTAVIFEVKLQNPSKQLA